MGDPKKQASPGPIYYPDLAFIGTGPHGKGHEYGIGASHRFPKEERLTTQADRPGPKYTIPSGLGVQVESHMRSFGAGKISIAPRNTVDVRWYPGYHSPGPQAYGRESLGLKSTARKSHAPPSKTGMGGAQRFFDSATRTSMVPGPGAYPIKSSVGGYVPYMKSYPVNKFGKGPRDFSYDGGVSPGPVYKIKPSVGTQIDSTKPSAPQAGFGSGSRFPVEPWENRDHQKKLKAVKMGGKTARELAMSM